MNEYKDILKDWKAKKNVLGVRGIRLGILGTAKVEINGNEAIFPVGKNRQVPERFKIINLESKKFFYSQFRNPADHDDYKAPFFNQQDFYDKTYIIITEGEWDCLSWMQKGYFNVVSLPNGSGNAAAVFQREFKWLSQFETIYINFDSDGPGKEAVEKVTPMIPKYKFRNIVIDVDGCKDANDALVAGYHLQNFFDSARRAKVDNVLHASEVSIESIFAATPKGISTGFYALDAVLGGLRPGEVTVISGDTSCGKTTLSCNIACNLAVKSGIGVWISSQEMRPPKILEKMGSIHLKKALREGSFTEEDKAELQRTYKKTKIFVDPYGERMTLASVLEGINFAYYAHGVKFIVIEDLGYLSTSIRNMEERIAIEYIMKKLHGIAIETGVHILLAAHPTQSKDDRGVMSMANLKGSSGIKQYADNVILVQRLDRSTEKLKKITTVTVKKNRAMGKERTALLEYHEEYDGFDNSVLTPATLK